MIQTKSFQFDMFNFRRQFRRNSLPLNDLVCSIGNYFLGAPYLAETLESGHKEKLVVNFAQFDCFTFVETVLALTRCVGNGKISLREFRWQLQLIRYRTGVMDGYSSRLHYFTDWLHDNKKKGVVSDISRQIGAKPQYKVINFLSAHRAAYPALQEENVFREIRKMEKIISRRKLYILPPAEFRSAEGRIKTGDIIALASSAAGLDVAHVGFALWYAKKLHLLNASRQEKSVVISSKPLIDYLRQNEKYTGIIVGRVNPAGAGRA
jgi:hypothetical protein